MRLGVGCEQVILGVDNGAARLAMAVPCLAGSGASCGA
jgi:hypothetical protein